ncbi:hypothetical protein AURDEDRAFT_164271 [Auricularia subglabra TFB-10046 SS5]|nr:hypothetical protein AURDEDRAFT_164271 [Auricularia subglabra TFB-10046 SS5]
MSRTEVLIEDDNALYVSYFPPSAWEYWKQPAYHGQSYHITRTPGAYATFVFNGSYMAYVSDMNYNHGEFDVFLNGEEIFNGTSYSDTVRMQQVLFESTLEPGRHTMSFVNGGGGFGEGTATVMGVDYFIYRPWTAQLAAPSTRGPGSGAYSKAEEYAIIAAFSAVGLALGILTVVFFVLRRRIVRWSSEFRGHSAGQSSVTLPSAATPPPYMTGQPIPDPPLTKLDRWDRLRK